MNDRGRSTQWRLTLTLAFAVLAFVLGYVGFGDYLDRKGSLAGTNAVDRVYDTLQLFVLSATPLETGPFGWPLDVARFLAPATTVFALGQTLALLFGDWFRSWRFRNEVGHSVVVGDTPAAAQLARSLVREGRKRVVLVGAAAAAELGRRQGMLIVSGEPTDESTLRAAGVEKAGTVYTLSPSGATNAAVALAVRALCVQPGWSRAWWRRRRPRSIGVFAQVRDDVLVTALRLLSRDPEPFELDFFVLDDVAARVLLDDHPAGEVGASPKPVVIAGYGLFGQAVLREVRRRQRSRTSYRTVTLVTAETVPPELVAQSDQDRVRLMISTGIPADAGSSTVYVCYVDADEVLRSGLGQLRAGAGHVVLCLRRLAELGEKLDDQRIFAGANSRLRMFGILDAAFAPGLAKVDSTGRHPDTVGGRLRGDSLNRIARAIHAQYVADRLAKGEAPGGNRVPWEQLPVHIQVDNIAQAQHVGAKLTEIRAATVPLAPDPDPFTWQPGEVDTLARMEHERWMAARNDPSDPDHKDWDDPSFSSDRKDVDRMFVRALPDVLAQAGFQIIRWDPPT